MEKCYVCRNEVVNGEEICIGPAEHLSEDVVVCMNCKLDWLEGIQKDRCWFGCDKEGVERLTFGYESGGQAFDEEVFVCKDCVNELGREGCIEEIRREYVQ